MDIVKAILVTLVAASVGMLPVAGSMAYATVSGSSVLAMHSDCCPEGEPCEKEMPRECGGSAGCLLKCFNFSTAVTALMTVMMMGGASGKSLPVVESLEAQAENPPSPPPRV
jgi:hypothetical protein